MGNAAEILGGRYGSFKLLDEAQVNSPTTKVLVSEVNKLLPIYYTLPVTSAALLQLNVGLSQQCA